MVNVDSTQQTLAQSLGLARIVQVDDANVKTVSLERVIDAAGALGSREALEALQIATTEADYDDNWRNWVQDHWEKLSDNEQQTFAYRVLDVVHQLDPDVVESDALFQSSISGLIPGAQFVPLSYAGWVSEHADIIESALQLPTLVLFDLNFEREKGGDSLGLRLLKQSAEHAHLFLGILSRNATLHTEAILWESFSATTGVPRERFVVLSKARVETGEPGALVDGLRRTVLAQVVETMRRTCDSILEKSVASARVTLSQISVYDFDQVIFRSSDVEGVWEGDTFFRVFNSEVRQHAQQAMHASSDLRECISNIRRLFSRTVAVDTTVRRDAWKYHRSEIYEDPKFVNTHCLPTSNGDIYEVESPHSGPRQFVLVGQPCDLAVRPKGERSNDRKLGRMGFWLEIVKAAKGERKDDTYFELPYFRMDFDEVWCVRPQRIHFVHLAALDLCALNASGVARLPLDRSVHNSVLLPGWEARAHELQKFYKKALCAMPKAEVRDDATRAALVRGVIPQPCLSYEVAVGISGTPKDRVLDMGLKRIGRVASQRASALLTRVAACVSRPGFEHDLTRDYPGSGQT